MIVSGEVGALRRYLRHLEWEFGNILEGGGISFSSLLDLRWGLGQRLVFGIMFSVGIVR
jgi:hypothetical protein